MAVARRQTTAVIDDHELSVTILPTNKRDRAASCGSYGGAERRFDVLARVELVTWPTKGIAASAKTAFECSAYGPDRRCVTALTQDGFVRAQVFFEPAHLGYQRGESHLVQRQGWTTASGSWSVLNHT